MRDVDYRVDVLRNGAPLTQLEFATAPSISVDNEADIKMTMRGEFKRNEAVNYLSDELRPVMILDGVEHNLGIYRVGTKSSAMNDGVTIDTVECYDRSVLLNWAKVESIPYFPAGTRYAEIISGYLQAAGIKAVMFVTTDAELQTDRSDWDVGTSYLKIVNTLLEEINYKSIWFDVEGMCRIEPYEEVSMENIKHNYGPAAVSMISDYYASETDMFETPNVFIVVCENPEYGEVWTARAENTTPASKLSTISRGLRIPKVYKVDNIASESALQEYAEKICNESMQTSEQVTITTANFPDHNPGDTIAVSVGDLEGVFRETGYSMSLTTGAAMTHNLQRMVIV